MNMVLFVDTFLSEVALSPNRKLEWFLKCVQEKSYVYRKQSKADIFRYSLASYGCIKWSKVIIRVDGDARSVIESLGPCIQEIFPEVDIAFERSNTGTKYAKALEAAGDDNPWIFFSPNNDHPFIHHDPIIFEHLLAAAERAEVCYGLPVSVLFSHFTETINAIRPEGFLYGYTGDFCKVLDEDEYSYTVKYDHLSLLSLQIYRKQHLQGLMQAAGDNRVIRSECLGSYNNYHSDSIMIVPKSECCRHYDAYMHTSFVVRDFITASRVPPLFIPDNFFSKEIRIRYGFEDYVSGYVNINPAKTQYSFDSADGTDVAVMIDEIPAFWRDRIAIIEINPDMKPVDKKDCPLILDVINPWRNLSPNYIQAMILYRKMYYSGPGALARRVAGLLRDLLRKMVRLPRPLRA